MGPTGTGIGIVSPPPVLLDVAAELNEAYSVEQPLAALLQRHRLLAMARSPLWLRIATLRRLAELDGNNPVWAEDLHTFEQERLKQLQQEAAAAIAADDSVALSELCQELHNTGWQELPPESLVQWVEKACHRLERQRD